MTPAQFENLCKIVKSGWRNTNFLDSEDLRASFFNSLNRFDYRTCREVIISDIETGRYDESNFANSVTMSKLISDIEQESYRQKETSVRSMFANGVKCPICHDNGYTLDQSPFTGIDVMRPCDCPAGHIKYPWAFMSEEELNAQYEEARKRGQHPSKAWRCKPEVYREAYYGKEEGGDDRAVGRAEAISRWREKLLHSGIGSDIR